MREFPYGFEKVKNFKEIFDNGRKFKTFSSQIIVYLEKTSPENSKINLSVLALKKIVGKKAVWRNKAKRRFKHAFLTSLRLLPLTSGFCIKIVAMTNKNTILSPWEQILKDTEKELKFINKEIEIQKGNIDE